METKGYRHNRAGTPRWLNIANLFTLARLACVPFAVRAILSAQHGRALGIVLGAALTDAIDGALARRFGMATSVGAYLDPITDKIFLSAIYISLAITSSIPWWLVIEIFTRDFLILAFSGAAILFTNVRRFPPTIWGKASTFLQIALALSILVRNASPDIVPAGRPGALVWMVAAVTALSGVHYLWRGLRDVAGKPAPSRGTILL
jgi:cardiolipin synthase (CMP-forming)